MQIKVQAPDITQLFSQAKREKMTRLGSFGALQAIKSWYDKLPADYFDSTQDAFPDGTPKHGKARTFARALPRGWSVQDRAQDSFALAFRHTRDGSSPWGLRLQEYGGTIRPKNARALTIPMTAEARGRRASEFSAIIHDLFVIGKRKATGENLGILAYRGDDGNLHAAYALRKSATIKPLHVRRGYHAVPQSPELAKMLSPIFRKIIFEVLSAPE